MNKIEAYNKIATLHNDRFNYIRIGQMFTNFEFWHKSNFGRDLFYESDATLLAHFEEYLNQFKGAKQDGE